MYKLRRFDPVLNRHLDFDYANVDDAISGMAAANSTERNIAWWVFDESGTIVAGFDPNGIEGLLKMSTALKY